MAQSARKSQRSNGPLNASALLLEIKAKNPTASWQDLRQTFINEGRKFTAIVDEALGFWGDLRWSGLTQTARKGRFTVVRNGSLETIAKTAKRLARTEMNKHTDWLKQAFYLTREDLIAFGTKFRAAAKLLKPGQTGNELPPKQKKLFAKALGITA